MIVLRCPGYLSVLLPGPNKGSRNQSPIVASVFSGAHRAKPI